MALTDVSRPTDVAMLTDLYELTMAQGLWENGKLEERDCFTAFYRDKPFGSAYAVMCGTSNLPDLVENLRFTDEDIDYLASLFAPAGGRMFNPAFLEYLRGFPVAEFGLRRAQGPDGGMAVARASYVAGAASTSNVLAGRKYGIPVFGTHAHSWVMSFDTELEAFRAFAASMPNNCTLLIDTYDVREGIENAITVAKEMEARGERLSAVRIDSGDLAKLSAYVRDRMDAEGLGYVKISVSNDLDEYTIQSLLSQGAPIDSFGVGTKLATCYDQPALGGVYKLSARLEDGCDEWTPVVKLSEQPYKRTIPGRQHIRRFMDEAGSPVCDMIYDEMYMEGEGTSRGTSVVSVDDAALVADVSGLSSREVMVPIVRDGHAVAPRESIELARTRCREALDSLDDAYKRFLYPQSYMVGMESGLSRLRDELVRERMAETAPTLMWKKRG